jgi:hypothetical protein
MADGVAPWLYAGEFGITVAEYTCARLRVLLTRPPGPLAALIAIVHVVRLGEVRGFTATVYSLC